MPRIFRRLKPPSTLEKALPHSPLIWRLEAAVSHRHARFCAGGSLARDIAAATHNRRSASAIPTRYRSFSFFKQYAAHRDDATLPATTDNEYERLRVPFVYD